MGPGAPTRTAPATSSPDAATASVTAESTRRPSSTKAACTSSCPNLASAAIGAGCWTLTSSTTGFGFMRGARRAMSSKARALWALPSMGMRTRILEPLQCWFSAAFVRSCGEAPRTMRRRGGASCSGRRARRGRWRRGDSPGIPVSWNHYDTVRRRLCRKNGLELILSRPPEHIVFPAFWFARADPPVSRGRCRAPS